MTGLLADAHHLAEVHLAEALPRRFRHVEGVARQARRIAPAFDVADREILIVAAQLHDIGYAPTIATTGFHPLDGAWFLQREGWDARICALVAHHSCAIREAVLRGLGDELSEFADERSDITDALWYCDMTTSPDGELVAFRDRLDEITSRYGPDSLVGQFIDSARSDLSAAVVRTEARIDSADVGLI